MSKKQKHNVPLSAELMQKYREGKLSVAEMHRVERLLLDDPFYADAMEGFEKTGKNDSLKTHLEDLKEQLHQRAHGSRENIPLYHRYWQTAAAVALLAVCSWLGYSFFTDSENKPEEQMLSMQNESEVSTQQKPMPLADEEARTESQQPEAIAPVENSTTSKNQKSESPVNKTISKAREAESVEKKEEQPILPAPETLQPMTTQQPNVETEIEEDEQMAIAKVPEERAGNTYRSTRLLKSADTGAEVYGEGQSFYTLKGKVISGEDKTGVPGANVMIKNTATGIVTDVNGDFELPVPENKKEVVFSSVGFQTVEKKVTEADSNLTVVLEPDIEALSEVVIVGYGAQEKKTATITQAKPSVGYASYKNYLKENLQYPQDAAANNIEGVVKVAFEVMPSGKLQNFSIEKLMGYGCDEEAIRLIREGPIWEPALEDGKPIVQNVMVKVKFSLKN